MKVRILATFRQTLELAEQGSLQEALLGCDFILRLDSLFEPARLLQSRLEDSDGAVDVIDLLAIADATTIEEKDEDDGSQPIGSEDPTLAMPTVPDLDLSRLDEPVAGIDSPTETDLPFDREAPTEGIPRELIVEAGGLDDLPENTLNQDPTPDVGGDQRIQDLLTEGQAGFEQREYQNAIDAWSRIFLIDIDHPEANRRIELARKLKAEVEREVEQTYHEGLTHVEKGSIEEARHSFAKVLEIQPHHTAALEYIQKIDAGELKPAADAPPPPPPGEDDTGEFEIPEDVGASFLESGDESLNEEIFVPPDGPSKEPGLDVPAPPKKSKAKPSRNMFILIGSAVLLLVLAGAWFFLTQWERFFPNSVPETVNAPARPDPISRALKLNEDGKTPVAIAQLRRLPANHPDYAEAQSLIAQWETAAIEDEPVEETRPEDLARHSELIGLARQAYAERRYLLASEYFAVAADIVPLEGTAAELSVDALEQLRPIESELAMFQQGDWEYALPTLWRMYEADHGNLDAKRLLIDSYYNMGVRDLQRSDPGSATGKFEEALTLVPGDPELERLLDFAKTYEARSEDLLHRTFVKYLPFR